MLSHFETKCIGGEAIDATTAMMSPLAVISCSFTNQKAALSESCVLT
jgi:hypothetical protein